MKIKPSNPMFLDAHLEVVQKAEGDDSDTLTIKGFANCTTKDRAGDIIIEDAWKGAAMDNYLKNPIILAYHNHSKPIGKMTDFKVTSLGLEITAEISKAAGDVYDLVKEGVLKAFSVGFRVLDADYDSATDIFLIKDVELHEVSVVSIPCNQDSIFSVSKSFDNDADLAAFKVQFEETVPENEPVVETDTTKNDGSTSDADHQTDPIEEDLTMDPKELQKLIAQGVTAAMEAERVEAARLKAIADAKDADDARIATLVKSGTEDLLAELETKRVEEATGFAKTIEDMQATIVANAEELIALQKSKVTFTDRSGTEEAAISAADAEDAVFLSKLLSKGMFDTDFGKTLHEKAVNASSSGTVSSEAYETVFSTNIERDIQDMLVMAPLFREISMNSATLVLPIRPDAVEANWVSADQINGAGSGRDKTTTGAEITMALTEITLATKKLAGKTYITDETEEDVLIPLLPLLRDSLVEAHAKKWDATLISSDGTGNAPIGLIPRAITAGGVYVVEHAKIAGGSNVKIQAKDLIALRRGMGQWGLNIQDLALVVNLDCYWDLLEDPDFAQINEVGAALATRLSGQVGTMFGLPVIVSTQFPTIADDSVFAILANKKNFMVPRQRGMIVQSDYSVEEQRRVLVATQRVGFSETIVGKGVAIMTYDTDGS